ncbi:MAG TPA: alpha/beta fold hydrolase [Anaerolineales bacterium]|nr:alpha/beta fold hydrolase [Anaerolineales bacterium]
MSIENRYTQVQGISTRYWAEGRQGSDIVLVHGLGGYAENWAKNFEALAGFHRVHALDLPGHGLSGKPLDAPYTIDFFAEFVRDFMQTMGIERAHLVGHSLGGAVTARFAARFPEKVETLVLVSSAGLGKEVDFPTRLLTIPGVGERIMTPNRAGIRLFLKNLVYDPALVDDALIDLQVHMALQPSAQTTLFKTLRAFSTFWGQKRPIYEANIDSLTKLSLPLCLLWGRNDPIVPVAHAHSLAQRIPDLPLKIFASCKHLPMMEHAQTFNDTLQGWIATQSL